MDPHWKEYRRRCWVFRLALLLTPAWMIYAASIRTSLVGYGLSHDSASFLTFMPMLALLIVAHLRRILWPCPRCGRPFHVTWWYSNTWARRCVHCGLPKWTSMQKQGESDFA